MRIFAHRGASRIAPENTLAAIELALDMPIYGIEIDVYPVGDDYAVMHDRWLTRTTNFQQRYDCVTVAQLRSLEAGIFNDEIQRVPLLSEILALDWSDKVLNIELKQLANSQHFITYLNQYLLDYDIAPEHILVSAFNHHYLAQIARLAPQLKRGWLTASLPLDLAEAAQRQGCACLNVAIDMLTPELVEDANSRNLPVYVFTVDELDDIDLVQQMGVTGVFTNYPEVVAAHLAWQHSQG